MYSKKLIAVALAFCVPQSVIANTEGKTDPKQFVSKKYESFEVVLNCDKRGLEFYIATVAEDKGNQRREDADFALDPSVPSDCQPSSTRTFGPGFHRGHMQGANTSENSKKAYSETFYMTNVLPMRKELNMGAWHYTDQIIECLRDKGQPLTVMAGTIWQGPHSSNFTVRMHGTPVPSAFWKIIKQGEKQVAWIIPNSKTAVKQTLPKWESTVEEIQELIGYQLPIDVEPYRNYRPDSWYNTQGCDLS